MIALTDISARRPDTRASGRGGRIVLILATALVVASCGGGDDASAAGETGGSEADQSAAGSEEPAGQHDTQTDDDAEAEGDTGSAPEASEDAAMITVDGQEFSFTPVQCNIDAEETTVVGNGETDDGEPFKGQVVIVTSGAGETASIVVGIGNDGITASAQPEDRPLYESSQIIDPVTYEISGSTATGEGPLHDSNEVAAPQSETFPMTFDVTCS